MPVITAREQVDQVLASVPPDMNVHPLTRCTECNELLTSIKKEDARDCVPTYVYESNSNFLQCIQCGRIYWPGTHVKRMKTWAK